MFCGTILLQQLLIWGQIIAKLLDLTWLLYFQTFFLLWSLFSVVVVLRKEWLQMHCLLQCLKHQTNRKKCLHLLKISTLRCCGSWATGRNSQKLGCTCSIVACSCVIWVSAQRSMLAVCLCCYVCCVLWVWKILPWCRPWTITLVYCKTYWF